MAEGREYVVVGSGFTVGVAYYYLFLSTRGTYFTLMWATQSATRSVTGPHELTVIYKTFYVRHALGCSGLANRDLVIWLSRSLKGRRLVAGPHLGVNVLGLVRSGTTARRHFSSVFGTLSPAIRLAFFCPISRCHGQPIPGLIRRVSRPLSLGGMDRLRKFVVANTPVRRVPFTRIRCRSRIAHLVSALISLGVPRLCVY